MADFILNVFAEIADFFINFWADKIIDKFAKRNKSKIIRLWSVWHGEQNFYSGNGKAHFKKIPKGRCAGFI